MLSGRPTLAEFLIRERAAQSEVQGSLNGMILDVALACKIIAKKVAAGELAGALDSAGTGAVQGEEHKQIDVLAEEVFRRAVQTNGRLGGMVSEEAEGPLDRPAEAQAGDYLLLFDPLDGVSNIDVNVSVGSIFSILSSPDTGRPAKAQDFLQPGTAQLCAGYAIYGPSTMLVLTIGAGTHAFTLDPVIGEFVLTHPGLQILPSTQEFAINASNSRHWEGAVKRYVNECLAGSDGERNQEFNMRWVASLVAEAHRILMRGGVFLYPRDIRDPDKAGRLRLLYEANPIAFVVEQAGGAATDGRHRLLDLQPTDLHQRVGFVFGSREEVERISRYHDDSASDEFTAPLFGSRGLFQGTR